MFSSGRGTTSGIRPRPGLVRDGFRTIMASVSIRVIMNEYYKAKLNKWCRHCATSLTSYTCLSLPSDPGFGEGPSVLSKRISEGPSSTLPLSDLDIGCDLVDRE